MKDGKTRNAALLLASTFLGAVGQLLFKFGLNSAGIESVLLWVGIGFIAYALSTIVYIFVLSRTHLSWAYGIGGLSYIFATFFAFYILMENIPIARWIGIGVIFVGVVIVGLS